MTLLGRVGKTRLHDYVKRRVVFVRDGHTGYRCAPPRITTEKWKVDGPQQTENHRHLYSRRRRCWLGTCGWLVMAARGWHDGKREPRSVADVRAIPRPKAVSRRSRTKLGVLHEQMQPSTTTSRSTQRLHMESIAFSP